MQHNPNEKRTTLKVSKFSRRQFLERIGVTVGSGALATLALAAACKTAGSTTTEATDTTPTTAPTPTTSVPAASTTTPTSTPPASTTPTSGVPTSATPTSSAPGTTPPTSTPAATRYAYVPPATPPPLREVPGSDCTVATDRAYSEDHVWVRTLPDGLAVLGISRTLVTIVYEPYNIILPEVGQTLAKGDTMSEVGGYKLSADVFTPVSGQVVDANSYLVACSGGALIEPLQQDPYTAGWLLVVKLSQPEELGKLLTAQQYYDLILKSKG